MTSVTDNLIASLRDDMTLAKPVVRPLRLFGQWMLWSLLSISFMVYFSKIRPDLPVQMHDVTFIAEIALLAAMMVLSAISAILLSYPDRYQKHWLVWLPLLPVVLFVALLVYECMTMPLMFSFLGGGECTICICLYSSVPAFVLMRLLRKQATTAPLATGMVALLAASSMACLAIRLVEENSSIGHLIVWHYIPLVALALLGVLLGKKMLKW